MRAIFVGGPLEGDRIGVPEKQPVVVVQRVLVLPEAGMMRYGHYHLVSEGVYRWMGWDDDE